MESVADVAAVAAVLANRARAAMLDMLMDGRAHPAGDLAREGGVALSTASGHLSALVEAGLVVVEPSGRQRRYRLARPEVARAIEALAVVAPRRPVSSLRAASAAQQLRNGRTCYDHLAGRLGVAVTDALVARRAVRARAGTYVVTASGERLLATIGVDVDAARLRRRRFAFACQDWTERRSHLGGALGAEVCDRLFALGWVARRGAGRAIALTDRGSAGLRSLLGLKLEGSRPPRRPALRPRAGLGSLR